MCAIWADHNFSILEIKGEEKQAAPNSVALQRKGNLLSPPENMVPSTGLAEQGCSYAIPGSDLGRRGAMTTELHSGLRSKHPTSGCTLHRRQMRNFSPGSFHASTAAFMLSAHLPWVPRVSLPRSLVLVVLLLVMPGASAESSLSDWSVKATSGGTRPSASNLMYAAATLFLLLFPSLVRLSLVLPFSVAHTGPATCTCGTLHLTKQLFPRALVACPHRLESQPKAGEVSSSPPTTREGSSISSSEGPEQTPSLSLDTAQLLRQLLAANPATLGADLLPLRPAGRHLPAPEGSHTWGAPVSAADGTCHAPVAFTIQYVAVPVPDTWCDGDGDSSGRPHGPRGTPSGASSSTSAGEAAPLTLRDAQSPQAPGYGLPAVREMSAQQTPGLELEDHPQRKLSHTQTHWPDTPNLSCWHYHPSACPGGNCPNGNGGNNCPGDDWISAGQWVRDTWGPDNGYNTDAGCATRAGHRNSWCDVNNVEYRWVDSSVSPPPPSTTYLLSVQL